MSPADICEQLKSGVGDVLEIWHELAREQPWFPDVEQEGIDHLPELILGLADAALCAPGDIEAHRQKVAAATEHGRHRREQGQTEAFILSEYHLLRQSIWRYLVDRFGCNERTSAAIMLIDTAITVATNASLWGFHREEAEQAGLWEGMEERLAAGSPLLHRARSLHRR